MQNVHKFLSRIDITKDAKEPPSIVSSKLFNYCANMLFGNMGPYEKSKETIIEYVNKNTTHIPIGFKIIDIINNDNVYPYVILQNITYAVQDSGIAPNTLVKDIKYIVSPGSVLDPCARNKTDVLYYGFDKFLSEKIFRAISFNHIKSLYISKNKLTNIINIDFLFNKNIKIVIDKEYKIIDGDYVYFGGNTIKNNWFNTQTEIGNKEIIEGYTYILCKELGDTLQALYTRFYMNESKSNNNVCLFTSDILLCLRCRLLNVPVVVKNYYHGLNDFMYYPNKSNMDLSMKYIELDKLRSQNNSIIYHIDTLLKKGTFFLNTIKLSINEQSKKLFESIKKSLQQYTTYTESLDTTFTDYMLYCKLINQYKANHILTDKNGIYYLYNVSLLYPNLKKDILNIDIIKNSSSNLFKLIIDIYGLSDKKYGGDSYSHLDEHLEKNDTYITNREYRHEEENSTTMIKRILYTTCRDKYSDASIVELYLIVENIYNIIFNYFDYLHQVCYNEEFIDELVEYFDRTNFILSISTDEFMNLFNFHKDRILQEKKKEELLFAKECDALTLGSMKMNEIKSNDKQFLKKINMVFGGKRLNKTKRRPQNIIYKTIKKNKK